MNVASLRWLGLVLLTGALGCKGEPQQRGSRLADLTGAVLEVAVRDGWLVVKLDARGCPTVPPETRVEANGIVLKRADGDAGGVSGEVRGCSGRWTAPSSQIPRGHVQVRITDASAKVFVEALALTAPSGFHLVSRGSLTDAHAGEVIFVEGWGPAGVRIARAEVVATTKKGDKFKVPAQQLTIGGNTLGFTMPAPFADDAGPDAVANGVLTVTTEGDAIVHCEGAVRCSAPVKATTDFALVVTR